MVAVTKSMLVMITIMGCRQTATKISKKTENAETQPNCCAILCRPLLRVRRIFNLGTRVPTGEHRYGKVPVEHVMILFEPPRRPYEQIGIVSSLGGIFASEGDMFTKMQMAAAGLGAGAVIVRGSRTTI